MGINLGIKWRYNGFPSLQYWQNHRFTKGMKPRSRTTQWHLLLWKNCYSAAFLVSKVNLTNPSALPTLSCCPQKMGEKEQCGTEKSGPPFESEVQNGLRQEAWEQEYATDLPVVDGLGPRVGGFKVFVSQDKGLPTANGHCPEDTEPSCHRNYCFKKTVSVTAR